MNKEIILSVKNLSTYFFLDDELKSDNWTEADKINMKNLISSNRKILKKQISRAVDDVSFDLFRNETLGIVGESGSGKSVTAFSILKLISDPPGKIISGEIFFNSTNLLSLKEHDLMKVRGNKISMIFQEPMTSLNPVLKIGDQLTEGLIHHLKISKKEAEDIAVKTLEEIGFPEAAGSMRKYPHQLSGGMRQRVMIAMALVCNPDILIADEPTTALDVTIQSQILKLITGLKSAGKISSVILITHNLGIVAEVCDRVIVMYAGKIQECADTPSLFNEPLHPYSSGLIKSIPSLVKNSDSRKLYSIKGTIPSPAENHRGCRFAGRCEQVFDKCLSEEPALKEAKPKHFVRCHLIN